MDRGIEQGDVDAGCRKRHGVKWSNDTLHIWCAIEERPGSAEAIHRIVPNIERNRMMPVQRDSIAQPPVPSAEIEHLEKAAQSCRAWPENARHERLERACSDRPLRRVRAAPDVGKR